VRIDCPAVLIGRQTAARFDIRDGLNLPNSNCNHRDSVVINDLKELVERFLDALMYTGDSSRERSSSGDNLELDTSD
jgi:hypothetical protein